MDALGSMRRSRMCRGRRH